MDAVLKAAYTQLELDAAIKENGETKQAPSLVIDEESVHRKIWGQPQLQGKLYEYITDHSRMSEVVCKLWEESRTLPSSLYATTPDEYPILDMLVKLVGAETVIDVGTFTGLSALIFAEAIGDNGKVITIDHNQEHLPIAKKYWEMAGVSQKIIPRIGVAMDILTEMKKEGYAGKVDFAFIDADKINYDAYYENLMTLVRPGGVIALDNCFYFGKVADSKFTDKVTCTIRALNKKLYMDNRIDFSLIPLSDGIAVCRVKSNV